LTLADYVHWALRHCRKRLFESALIVLAVGLGVGVVISVLALFDGVRLQQEAYLIQDQYRTITVRTVEDIRAVFADATGPLIAVPNILAEQIVFGVQDVINLKAAVPHAYVFAEQTGMYPTSLLLQETEAQSTDRWNRASSIYVRSITPDYFGFHNLQTMQGALFMDMDVAQANRVIVLGHGLANRLFADVNPLGQVVPLGTDNQPYTVVGVLQEVPMATDRRQGQANNPNDQAFIPLTAQPSASSRGGSATGMFPGMAGMMGIGATGAPGFNEIRVGLATGRYMGSTLRQTREYMYQTYGDTISVHSAFEAYQAQNQRFLFMGMVVGLFSSLGLVIAAINILNLMMARIYRRFRTIGISISVGASRKTVFRQFLVEAAILGMVGAMLGIVFSFGGVKLISAIVGEPVKQTISAQVAGVAVALTISLLFGVYPAQQAARINPVDALRVN
jgi:putative ABC transport system permease protein